MNNTFNINRFGLLLKRQLLDFGKIYLISLLALTGILVGFYYFNLPKIEEHYFRWNQFSQVILSFRLPIFLMFGFIFISVIASSYFTSLGQKPKAIMELMVPASLFEKLLLGIFFTAIVGLASYLLIFYIVDKTFIIYLDNSWRYQKILNTETNLLTQVTYSSIVDDITSERKLYGFFALPFLTTSIFLLGSVYFNRFHYIKTAISVMIFIGAASYIIYKSASLLTRNMVGVHQGSFQNREDLVFLLIFLVITALTLIFWAITYVRLKEKEV